MSVPALSPTHRVAAILAPVFALRHEDDLGCGDTRALCEFIDWAVEYGFRIVQILPINETGGDHSPYNAISSMALDVTTLDLRPRLIPELTAVDCAKEYARAGLHELRTGPVRWPAVKELKWRLVERAFDRFEARTKPERRRAFEAFRARHAAWLRDYTLYRALMERNAGRERFDDWEPGQQSIEDARGWLAALDEATRAAFERRRAFFAYAQWLLWTQWEGVKEHANARGVAIMGDIPIGVSYYGADFYAHPEYFEPGWSGGAPPEPAFKDDLFVQRWGQNWGIPVFNWTAMARDDFAWWRQRVAGVRDLFHIFRIDHILGFYRLYSFPWRPSENHVFAPLSPADAAAQTGGRLPQFLPRDDSTPDHCEQNLALGDKLLRVILESAQPALLVAEDLGTVPAYVRPHLASLAVPGFRIPQWEINHEGNYVPGRDYPRLSVATYATHDHEPLAAMFQRWEQAVRDEAAGVPEAQGAGHTIRTEAWKLAEFAGLPEDRRFEGWNDFTHEGLVEGLFASESWIAALMITDLLGLPDRFNVPGIASDGNWNRRLAFSAAGMRRDPAIAGKMARMAALVEKCGRKIE